MYHLTSQRYQSFLLFLNFLSLPLSFVHSDLIRLFTSLNDAHTQYNAPSTLHFRFWTFTLHNKHFENCLNLKFIFCFLFRTLFYMSFIETFQFVCFEQWRSDTSTSSTRYFDFDVIHFFSTISTIKPNW